MKRFLLAVALFIPVVCVSVEKVHETEAQTVYICTGKSATTYHKTNKCRGLSRCSGDIKQVTIDKAKSMNRRACKICY